MALTSMGYLDHANQPNFDPLVVTGDPEGCVTLAGAVGIG